MKGVLKHGLEPIRVHISTHILISSANFGKPEQVTYFI